MIKKIERPDKVNSVTTRVETGCGKIYITIGFTQEGEPIEAFLNGSKSGGCKSNQEAIGRLASALLRWGLVEEVLDQLKGISCPSCQRKKATLPAEKRATTPNSCGDALAKVLEELKEVNISFKT